MRNNPKTDKPKTFTIVAVVFVIVVVMSLVSRFCSDGQNGSDDGDGEDHNRDCIEAGGTGTVYPGSLSCCKGLTALNCDEFDSEGICTMGCMGSFVCSSCGNDECDEGENECNCPGDCDESEVKADMSLIQAESIAKYNSECGSHGNFVGIDLDEVSFSEEDQKWYIGLKWKAGCKGVCVVDPVTRTGVLNLDCS